MKIIKTREFLYLDPEVNLEYRESISIVQTYGGYQMFYDIKNVEDGDAVYHAFLNRTIMSLAEAEEVLKIKSDGFVGMGYTEVMDGKEKMELEANGHYDAMAVIRENGFEDVTPEISMLTQKTFKKNGRLWVFAGWTHGNTKVCMIPKDKEVKEDA